MGLVLPLSTVAVHSCLTLCNPTDCRKATPSLSFTICWTTDSHRGCREPGHHFLVEFSKPPMGPRTRSKVRGQGPAGSCRLLSPKTPFHPQRHLSSSLAPVRSFLPRAGLGAQLAGALIWVPGMMMWVTKEPRITRGTN